MTYIRGDINLNILGYQSFCKVNKYLNLLSQHSFLPVVTKPSKVSKNNAALIDHVNTSSFDD